jgi:hypothetical protein
MKQALAPLRPYELLFDKACRDCGVSLNLGMDMETQA